MPDYITRDTRPGGVRRNCISAALPAAQLARTGSIDAAPLYCSREREQLLRPRTREPDKTPRAPSQVQRTRGFYPDCGECGR